MEKEGVRADISLAEPPELENKIWGVGEKKKSKILQRHQARVAEWRVPCQCNSDIAQRGNCGLTVCELMILLVGPIAEKQTHLKMPGLRATCRVYLTLAPQTNMSFGGKVVALENSAFSSWFMYIQKDIHHALLRSTKRRFS